MRGSGVLIYKSFSDRLVTVVQPGDTNFMGRTAFTRSNFDHLPLFYPQKHFHFFPPFYRKEEATEFGKPWNLMQNSPLIQRSFSSSGKSLSKKFCLPNFFPHSIWKSGRKRRKKFCLWNNGKQSNFDQDKAVQSMKLTSPGYPIVTLKLVKK